MMGLLLNNPFDSNPLLLAKTVNEFDEQKGSKDHIILTN
jgi:hypothetical protein